MNIGSKIKQLRQRSGYTQEQLASRVGVSAQTVSKWETSTSMPDITLLPELAGEFGVSVDELFDLTAQERMRRIDSRLERSEELAGDLFREYEEFLLSELDKKDNYQAVSLLAHLYHHRMEADARRVRKYAEDAIVMRPEKKDCQWLLNMASGQCVWDWNVANHAEVIDLYKRAIACDAGQPKTPLPYYYLIDNLLSDGRVTEAEEYLAQAGALPAFNKALLPVYRAHIALCKHDRAGAEAIMAQGLTEFGHDGVYLFEVAQYYAAAAEYEKAIDWYERYWQCDEGEKPRFTDALEGIAVIYGILGDKAKQIETYDRILRCLKEEWKYTDDDLPVREIEVRKRKAAVQ